VRFCIGPWEQRILHGKLGYRPPVGATWCMDFSTDAEVAAGGASTGRILVAVPDASPTPSGFDLLMQGDWKTTLSAPEVTLLRNRLRLPSAAGTSLADHIQSGRLLDGDPQAIACIRPDQPDRRVWRIYGPGSEPVVTAFDINSALAAKYRALMQAEYMRLKAAAEKGEVASPDGKPDPEFHQRWLTVMDEKLGINNAEDFVIPAGEPKPVKKPHNTSYGPETFNKADGALGPVLTWTEIVGTPLAVASNALAVLGADFQEGVARAEHDTSSSDMFAQATIASISIAGGSDLAVGQVGVRSSSSDVTAYYFGCVLDANGDSFWQWYRFSAGTEFGPIGSTDTTAASAGQVIRPEVSGSNLDGKMNGGTLVATTDSNIASGTRANIRLVKDSNGAVSVDSFSFGDLSSPPTVKPFYYHQLLRRAF
jgi:hypothetical protein